MIYFYSGTPGSGKSLDMAREISYWIKNMRKNVISNTNINIDNIQKNKKKRGKFYFLDNCYVTPKFFYSYAKKFHKPGKESQTLIVIDEAQMLFAPNTVKLKCQEDKTYRQEWLRFFTQHRHLGYDIILVSQFDKLIDAQVRCLFEFNVVHRKANNFGVLGSILTILRVPLFVKVTYWYGVNQICEKKFFTYRKKYGQIYDSYTFFSQVQNQSN